MTTNRSDAGCVRGCVDPGEHFAACPSYGVEGGECSGCVPAPTHRGTVVCADCYRRVRGILRNTPDLIGRLRSLASQGKAVAYSPVKVPAASATAPDQIGAELLDAILAIEGNLRAWSLHFDPRSLRGLDEVLTDPDQVPALWDAIVDLHVEDEDGGQHWSVADAMARWGVERRDRDRHVYPVDAAGGDDRVIARLPVREWYDELLVSKDAARRARVSESQLRRWVQAGVLEPAARLRDGRGVVTRWFHASAVDAAAEVMRARRHAGVASMPE